VKYYYVISFVKITVSKKISDQRKLHAIQLARAESPPYRIGSSSPAAQNDIISKVEKSSPMVAHKCQPSSKARHITPTPQPHHTTLLSSNSSPVHF